MTESSLSNLRVNVVSTKQIVKVDQFLWSWQYIQPLIDNINYMWLLDTGQVVDTCQWSEQSLRHDADLWAVAPETRRDASVSVGVVKAGRDPENSVGFETPRLASRAQPLNYIFHPSLSRL